MKKSLALLAGAALVLASLELSTTLSRSGCVPCIRQAGPGLLADRSDPTYPPPPPPPPTLIDGAA